MHAKACVTSPLQPKLSPQISCTITGVINHQQPSLEKTVSQVDGSDVTGKSEFERKLDSRFDQLIADLRNHLVSYWAGCHKFATQHETHESINKMKSPVSPVRGTNPSEKGNHYRKSGDTAQGVRAAGLQLALLIYARIWNSGCIN